MATPNTTILVTGGNRGIGRGICEHYLAKPRHTVIAAVRNPSIESSKSLSALPKGNGSSIITIKIDSVSDTDPGKATKELQTKYGIHTLDVVVANAGISEVFPPVSEVRAEDLLKHFNTNVLGVIYLFQAVLPFLNRSPGAKFITMSTSAASLGDMEHRNFSNTAYGTSKVALNYITRKIHFENPDLVAFSIDPGWVQTDMGNDGAKLLGLEKAEITVDESIDGITRLIDKSTREKTSGNFMSYEGHVSAW